MSASVYRGCVPVCSRAHLIPHDRVVRPNSIQASEECENCVNDEGDLSSQVSQDLSEYGALCHTAEVSTVLAKRRLERRSRIPRDRLGGSTASLRPRRRVKLTQVTLLGSLMSLSHLFAPLLVPLPAFPPFARYSLRVSGILPSIPIPLEGHPASSFSAFPFLSSSFIAPSTSSVPSALIPPVPLLRAVELSTTSIGVSCLLLNEFARGAEYSGSP